MRISDDSDTKRNLNMRKNLKMRTNLNMRRKLKDMSRTVMMMIQIFVFIK